MTDAGADADKTASGGGEPYVIFVGAGDEPTGDFYDSSETESLARDLRGIVEAEAPLLFDVMARRLGAIWGVSRFTARVMERVREVLASIDESHRPREIGRVVWRCDQEDTAYTVYRVPGAERRAEDLPPIEVVNAVRDVLRQQICLPRADLAREVARVFGITRLGKKVQAVMETGIATLEAQGDCVDDGAGIKLA